MDNHTLGSGSRVKAPENGFRPGVVSLVTATYNRPATLQRALDSVLRQDYPDWELIVVDDGQMPGTAEVLGHYNDLRLKIVKHDGNRGVGSARNTGLDHVTGEWFTLLDDDDEILPHALSTLMRAARTHPDADAFTCNCIDSVTGEFTGFGADSNQRVDWPDTYMKLRGEHWGITKTALLRGRRFDERLKGGFEGVLWLKLSAEARRYYVHEGLRIFHTEGADRTTKTNKELDLRQRFALFLPLADDKEYAALLRAYDRDRYGMLIFHLAVALVDAGRRREAWLLCREYHGSRQRKAFVFVSWALGPQWIAFVSKAERCTRSFIRFVSRTTPPLLTARTATKEKKARRSANYVP